MLLSSTVVLGAFIREAAHLRGRLRCALEEVQRSRERESHVAQERLARLTSYDVLTGLPNRWHIEDQLRGLALPHESPQPFAVLFVSIDGVKVIFSVPYEVDGDPIVLSASIGVALYPEDATTARNDRIGHHRARAGAGPQDRCRGC